MARLGIDQVQQHQRQFDAAENALAAAIAAPPAGAAPAAAGSAMGTMAMMVMAMHGLTHTGRCAVPVAWTMAALTTVVAMMAVTFG
ncbi:MAG TPA: hypothetical protein VF663_09620 [Telluria sp.]